MALDKRKGCVKRKLFPSGFATVVLAREAEEQDSGNLTQITFPWRLLSKIVPPTIDTVPNIDHDSSMRTSRRYGMRERPTNSTVWLAPTRATRGLLSMRTISGYGFSVRSIQ